MRERELLEHIYARSADLSGRGEVVIGPGDDCAVVRTGAGLLAIGVDQLVEGRHFEPDTPIDLIARKAVGRSISDLAAMGAAPCWGLATAVLPDGYANGDELFDRMAHWARHWGAPFIGGDIAASTGPLTLTVTAAGTIDEHGPVLRSGAQPGDSVYVTGPIGGSFASGRHLSFEPRLDAGRAAAGIASAMIDVSDGLGLDADRVARASGVVLEIDADAIPLHQGVRDWRTAAGEGEDYELLITGPGDADLGAPIGRVRSAEFGESPAAWFITPDGRRIEGGGLGWDHGGE